MVLVVPWAWDLSRPLHHVHINTIATSQVALGQHMELGASAALVFGNETEPALVLCCGQFIRAGSRETLGSVLEAGVLGGLRSQGILQALVKLLFSVQVVGAWSWNNWICIHILLDVHFLEVLSGKAERELSRLWGSSSKC